MDQENRYRPKIVRAILKTGGRSVEEYYEDRRDSFRSEEEAIYIKNANDIMDGTEVMLASFDYDLHSGWHLWNWNSDVDETIMKAMYWIYLIKPICGYRQSRQEFEHCWKNGEYDNACEYCFRYDQVEVIEVIQEEENVHNSSISRMIIRKEKTEKRCIKAKKRLERFMKRSSWKERAQRKEKNYDTIRKSCTDHRNESRKYYDVLVPGKF